ncbi:MAG: NAD(P)-dependent oxidoreductase [Xanthobacteraceae bacterium]
MKVAVLGASGNIGSQIVTEALSRGHSITGIARHPEKIAPRAGVTVKPGDLSDEAGLAAALRGHDAIISSVRFKSFKPAQLINAVKASGVKRLLVVGGAGSLEVRPGVALLDTPEFPEAAKEEATGGRVTFKALQAESGLDWTFLSPSAVIGPGERTGKFRLGGDQLLIGADGKSRISIPDFAIAMVDELEKAQHVRRRFTVGY